jgi:hypothetical protein
MRNKFEHQISELAKAKILRELQREQAASNVINMYGGGGIPTTLKEQMAAPQASNPDDEDYFVGIQRTPTDDKGGWNKMVRRFKTKKGEKAPSAAELFG